MSVKLTTKVIDFVCQMSCPYEYKNHTDDIRVGSSWCNNCSRFISNTSTRKGDIDYNYEVTVECAGEVES